MPASENLPGTSAPGLSKIPISSLETEFSISANSTASKRSHHRPSGDAYGPLARFHRRDASVLVRPGIRGDGSVGHGFDPDRLGRVRGVRATPRGFLTARSSGGGRDCQIAGNRRHSGPTWRGSARRWGRVLTGWTPWARSGRQGPGRAVGPERCCSGFARASVGGDAG